ncbi:hypothetical protein LX36DRAFT_675562 [Colletotrichum falcatum]|nr:hypothetical protein LX36DRAFT_675562 [Colletotrichum falcatum]
MCIAGPTEARDTLYLLIWHFGETLFFEYLERQSVGGGANSTMLKLLYAAARVIVPAFTSEDQTAFDNFPTQFRAITDVAETTLESRKVVLRCGWQGAFSAKSDWTAFNSARFSPFRISKRPLPGSTCTILGHFKLSNASRVESRTVNPRSWKCCATDVTPTISLTALNCAIDTLCQPRPVRPKRLLGEKTTNEGNSPRRVTPSAVRNSTLL